MIKEMKKKMKFNFNEVQIKSMIIMFNENNYYIIKINKCRIEIPF